MRRCVGLDVGGLGRGGNVSLDCERGWVGGYGDERRDLRVWILYDGRITSLSSVRGMVQGEVWKLESLVP